MLEHRRRLSGQFEEHVSHPVRLDAGRVAVCGEQGGTGHHVIIHVRPDRCLDILDIVEEAQVSQACERLQNLPLTGREPFKFRYGGKWCSFQATYKWPLIGVCQPNKETLLLLSIVGAGLMITGVWEEGYQSISVEDWRLPFDLGGPMPHTRAPEQASNRAPRRPARRAVDLEASQKAKPPTTRADAVQAEYARLASRRAAEAAREAFRLYMDHLDRQCAVPDPRLGGHKAVQHAPAVLMGLRTAAANGCLRLCGREKAIREQLARHGVYLPKGSVAPVVRLLIGVGCVFAWQLPAAKGRSFSKRYSIELGEALKPEGPMQLRMLQAIPTPHDHVLDDGDKSPAAPREQVPGEAAPTTAKPSPVRHAAPAPTLREFLQLALGLMLVFGREAVKEHELGVASRTTVQAAASTSPGVAAAPGPVPTEREVSPPPSVSPELASHEAECGPATKAGQADAAGGQGIGQRWAFAAAISSTQFDMAAGWWEEAVNSSWHALAWPLPRGDASPADVDPTLNVDIGDMLIEPGRPSRKDETPWLQGPASSGIVQPLGGVRYAAPPVVTRPWIFAHVKRSDAGPRGPPRQRK